MPSEELRRLRWRCRRGMLELDLVLLDFLDRHYAQLSTGERVAFQRLLSLPDTALIAFLHGTQEADSEELKNIVNKLR
jgi:antitoxin CptB